MSKNQCPKDEEEQRGECVKREEGLGKKSTSKEKRGLIVSQRGVNFSRRKEKRASSKHVIWQAKEQEE